MGAWGTGIYSNDTALEVKDMCQNVFAFFSVDEGNQIIFNQFAELLNSNIIDDDYASFWYALADWQWNHGILNDSIHSKANALLTDYTGINDWYESSNTRDIKKRQAVLEQLRNKLNQDMPPKKLPKAKLQKPKHMPGDIIIFQSKSDIQPDPWSIELLPSPWRYKSDMIRKSSLQISPPFKGGNKYYAILCVGSFRKERAEYLPGIFDEYSIYAFYDYCAYTKPSIQDLHMCGFLPTQLNDYDNTRKIFVNFNWAYTFYTVFWDCKKMDEINYLERTSAKSEYLRFQQSFNQKEYSNIPVFCIALYHAFYEFFSEKIRLQSLNIPVDTLLNDTYNPELIDTDIRIST